MSAYQVNGTVAEHDEEGYLSDIGQWNKDIAEVIAKAEQIEMTDEHWVVVNFLRDYYEEYQIAPAVRVLIKEMAKKYGKEKGNQKRSTRCSLMVPPSKPARSPACPSRPAASDQTNLSPKGRKSPGPGGNEC